MRQSLKQPKGSPTPSQPPVLPESINPTRELESAVAKLRHIMDYGKELSQLKAADALARLMKDYLPKQDPKKPSGNGGDAEEPLTPAKMLEWARQLSIMVATCLTEGSLTVSQVREKMASLLNLLAQNPR